MHSLVAESWNPGRQLATTIYEEEGMNSTNLLEAIRVVKENEKVAADFYANAAKKAAHPAGKQLFEQLSEFEQFHYAKLTELEKSYLERSDFIFYEGREFPLPPKLAPKEAAEPNQQTVINIIDQAIALERLAEKTYADLAAQITDQQGHAMFQKLSEEEHNHFRILTEAFWSLTNMQTWKWDRS